MADKATPKAKRARKPKADNSPQKEPFTHGIFIRLELVRELTTSYAPDVVPHPGGFSGAADVFAMMSPHFHKCAQEEFWVVITDVKNRVTGCRMITRGTLDASLVHPRDLFATAVLGNAASIILVHNHPSGDPEPSAEDVALTKRLADAGELMGIPVLDHVIVGVGTYVSLAERGVV